VLEANQKSVGVFASSRTVRVSELSLLSGFKLQGVKNPIINFFKLQPTRQYFLQSEQGKQQPEYEQEGR